MDIHFTPEEQGFRGEVRAWLAENPDHPGPARQPHLLPVAEDYDGFGGTGVENMLVMKELGRGLCLEPYLHSQIYGAGLIQQLGSAEQRQSILPAVAAGERRLAPAWS